MYAENPLDQFLRSFVVTNVAGKLLTCYGLAIRGSYRETGVMDFGQYVIVRPLSIVGYTSVVASVIHSRQWSN